MLLIFVRHELTLYHPAESERHVVSCCCFQEILDRTGYPLEITSGQRKYGGPPPNYAGPAPGSGHEVSSAFLS